MFKNNYTKLRGEYIRSLKDTSLYLFNELVMTIQSIVMTTQLLAFAASTKNWFPSRLTLPEFIMHQLVRSATQRRVRVRSRSVDAAAYTVVAWSLW